MSKNGQYMTALDKTSRKFIEDLAELKGYSMSKSINFCVTLVRRTFDESLLIDFNYEKAYLHKNTNTTLSKPNGQFIQWLAAQKFRSHSYSIGLCVALVRKSYPIDILKEMEIIA